MITHLTLRQFRNHSNTQLTFTSPLVIITGPNAIGKTNILESIYVSSLTKSFRVSDSKLLEQNKDFFTIDRVDDTSKIHVRLTLTGGTRKKSIKLNNIIKPHAEFIGQFPITLFEPNDLQLLTHTPQERRKFLNRIISQTNKKYLHNINMYQKILLQRNNLLKNAKKNHISNLQEQLFVYNIQLAEPAEYITKKRRQFTQAIQADISRYYSEISGQDKKITIKYYDSAKTKEEFIALLEQNQLQDSISTHTSVGPHREDFEILLENNNLSDTASRGEVRSIVLALKLTELDYIESMLKKRPTLLLDDVLSELDTQRQNFLLSHLDRQQTFLTTTHLPVNIVQKFQHIELPL